MKRIAALALALALLLTPLAALAEFEEPVPSPISTLALTNLSVSHMENGRAKRIPLKQMALSLSMGETAGVPTLQASFDNGKGQVMDLILQVVDSWLLFSVSGVSGTYYVDLADVSEGVDTGERLAEGLGNGLALAGPHLDGLLQGLSTVDAKGERRVRLELPEDVCLSIAECVRHILGGLDITGMTKADGLEDALAEADRAPALEVRYSPSGGRLALDVSLGGEALQLEADMALTVQPMVLVNISADPLMIDMMGMDRKQLTELRGELAILALKYAHFAGGTGLNRVLD